MEGDADGCGVVALLAIEQAVPDQRIDFAIANLDHKTAQAATTPLSVQAHTLGSGFPDSGDLSQWSADPQWQGVFEMRPTFSDFKSPTRRCNSRSI
jgi:hypothetical protein